MTDGTEDWESRARAAEARVEELAAERARLWEELHRLRGVEEERDYFRRLWDGARTSASWRVTSPLREAKRVAGRARRRLPS